jgi:CBS domain-containing protein
MDEKGVHHLAVVEGQELRGLLVAEGALLAMWRHPERRKLLQDLQVREVMTTAPLPTADPETRLRDAAQRMLAYGATALVIHDDQGAPAGILTARDLISALIAGGAVRHPED